MLARRNHTWPPSDCGPETGGRGEPAMKCPVCDTSLKLGDREGVEVDYCPKCHGVWLDQDELEQIIEHSNPIDWDWQRNDGGSNSRNRGRMS
jgi:Zn-finger nucleic acid-binding protein